VVINSRHRVARSSVTLLMRISGFGIRVISFVVLQQMLDGLHRAYINYIMKDILHGHKYHPLTS